MTEAEWLAATGPTPLLVYLRGCRVPDRDEVIPGDGPAVRCSGRKVALFVTAVCERVWLAPINEPTRRGMTYLQQYAAGEISLPDLLRSLEDVRREDERGWHRPYFPFYTARVDEPQAAHHIAGKTAVVTAWAMAHEVLHRSDPAEIERLGDNWRRHERAEAEWRQAYRQVETCQAGLLRDIVGNPFRPVTVDPAWLTPTVVARAEGIYGDRTFDRIPILADALADAGCDNTDVLAHCHIDGEHVRGCWAVDLVLGKT
jgi:hypothetical protein